jgi:hypothetical protein
MGLRNLPYWSKVLLISVILAILGNLIFFIVGSLNYGECYHDVKNYECNSGQLILQGWAASLLIIEPTRGMTYLLPIGLLFLIGNYLFPLLKKK